MAIVKFLLLLGTIISCHSSPPNIDDLFTSLTNTNLSSTITPPSNIIIKNISINLENLNLATFTEKLKSTIRFGNLSKIPLETRRLHWQGSWWEWGRATDVLIKNKAVDMMLQTIYMARHKIKQLESEAYYNPQDTSYRIAFLYRRLRRIWKRLMDVYTTMQRNRLNSKEIFTTVNPFLILHHKAAKLHVDFLYLWWVVMKMHEKYDFRHGIPNTTPLT